MQYPLLKSERKIYANTAAQILNATEKSRDDDEQK